MWKISSKVNNRRTQTMIGMKSRKTTGNGISAELKRYSGTLFYLRILHFLNKTLMENEIPDYFRTVLLERINLL